jgi:hypothetical protein
MKINVAITVDAIKTRPPIVGVPCFFSCHDGPSYKIVCPNLSLRRNGIRTGSHSAVIRKLITHAFIHIV